LWTELLRKLADATSILGGEAIAAFCTVGIRVVSTVTVLFDTGTVELIVACWAGVESLAIEIDTFALLERKI
jgi:hypothetical protein